MLISELPVSEFLQLALPGSFHCLCSELHPFILQGEYKQITNLNININYAFINIFLRLLSLSLSGTHTVRCPAAPQVRSLKALVCLRLLEWQRDLVGNLKALEWRRMERKRMKKGPSITSWKRAPVTWSLHWPSLASYTPSYLSSALLATTVLRSVSHNVFFY